MPTYRFSCKHCGLWTEKGLKITECDDVEKFPDCTECGNRMDKVWTNNENGLGFVLKGGGWFKKGGY